MLLVAHRTPRTRVGCEHLAAAGANVFELDVQVFDGRIVVSHYLPLFGLRGWLQHDNAQFRWHTGAARDPDATAAAANIPHGATVLLDLKAQSAPARAGLVAALAEQLADRASYRVCGPRPEDLGQLRAAGFRTWRTLRDQAELDRALADGPLPDEAVSVRHTLLGASSIARLREIVPRIVAWTVNGTGRARQLRELGVDGVTTDSQAVLRTLAGQNERQRRSQEQRRAQEQPDAGTPPSSSSSPDST